MIKKFDDLTVVEFGNGTVTVELGKYGSQYAVFINNTDAPGTPGQLAPKTKNTRGYEPNEIVLAFPSKQRATEVVNSLFNGELVKVGQQPTENALSKFLEKEEWNDAFAQGFNAGFNSDERSGPDVTQLVTALEEIIEWVNRWASADHPIATVARKALNAYHKEDTQ